jgi:hypothetical protein
LVRARLCRGADSGGDPLMSSQGPDDRETGTRRKRRRGDASDPTGLPPAAQEPTEQSLAPSRADEPSNPVRGGPPPGEPDATPTVAEAVGETADPDAEPPVHRSEADAGWSGYRSSAPPSADRRDRFGWPLPAGMDAETSAERPAAPERQSPPSPPGQRADPPRDDAPRPAPSYNPYDTSAWRVPPTPNAPPRGPYSGQMPVQPPNPDAPPRGGYSGQFPTQAPAPNQPPRGPYSGQFPAAQPPRQSAAFPAVPPGQVQRSGPLPIPPDARRSGAFPPIERGPDDRRSGAFPTVPDAVSQSGAYAAPPDPGRYDPARSGPIPQSPYISGAMPQIQRSGQFAYPGELTSTGSRRVIVAPDAGFGSLLTDRSSLVFLIAAVALAIAMIAFIAARYAHLPAQIALHFGPGGSSQPTRIGEKRELWTIPFIVGIVLAADTALAWAVYRFDRFAARLLTLGAALVGAIAWIVLLTVLHR